MTSRRCRLGCAARMAAILALLTAASVVSGAADRAQRTERAFETDDEEEIKPRLVEERRRGADQAQRARAPAGAKAERPQQQQQRPKHAPTREELQKQWPNMQFTKELTKEEMQEAILKKMDEDEQFRKDVRAEYERYKKVLREELAKAHPNGRPEWIPPPVYGGPVQHEYVDRKPLFPPPKLPEPGVLPPAWIHNMTQGEVEASAPSWHAVFALRFHPELCESCDHAVQVMNYVAHRVYMDAAMRSCVSFVLVDTTWEMRAQGGAASVPVDIKHPIGMWIPSRHEMHDAHNNREVFPGAWSAEKLHRYIWSKCSRAHRIGRVYVADIMAAQFAIAADADARQKVLDGLVRLRWQFPQTDTAQMYLRYYVDIMEAALKVDNPDHEYFSGLLTKVLADLNNEVYRDAYAEVQVIKSNILAAFLESAAHPHEVHGTPQLIPTMQDAKAHKISGSLLEWVHRDSQPWGGDQAADGEQSYASWAQASSSGATGRMDL